MPKERRWITDSGYGGDALRGSEDDVVICGLSQRPIARIEKGLDQLLLALGAAFLPKVATALAVIESAALLENLRQFSK